MKNRLLVVPVLTASGVLLSGLLWLVIYKATFERGGLELAPLAALALFLSEIGGVLVFGGLGISLYAFHNRRPAWLAAIGLYVGTALLVGIVVGAGALLQAQAYSDKNGFCVTHPKICTN